MQNARSPADRPMQAAIGHLELPEKALCCEHSGAAGWHMIARQAGALGWRGRTLDEGDSGGGSFQAQGPEQQAGKVVTAQQAAQTGQGHALQAEAEFLTQRGEAVDPPQGAASTPPRHPKAAQQPVMQYRGYT